jgi:hypothetical protein
MKVYERSAASAQPSRSRAIKSPYNVFAYIAFVEVTTNAAARLKVALNGIAHLLYDRDDKSGELATLN